MTSYFVGTRTESANTDIIVVCPAKDTLIPMLRGFSVTTGGFSQTLYMMTTLSIIWTTSFTRNGTTTSEVCDVSPAKDSDGNPKTFAAGDIMVAINERGQYETLIVASVSGKTITWQYGPSEDILHGSLLYCFYNPAEGLLLFPPTEGSLHKNIDLPANTTTTLDNLMYQSSTEVPISGITDTGTPMALLITNDVAQCYLEYAEFAFYKPMQDELDAAREKIVVGDSGIEMPEITLPPLVFPKG